MQVTLFSLFFFTKCCCSSIYGKQMSMLEVAYCFFRCLPMNFTMGEARHYFSCSCFFLLKYDSSHFFVSAFFLLPLGKTLVCLIHNSLGMFV